VIRLNPNDIKSLETQVIELLRLEFEIREDLEKQQSDLRRVQEQRELVETQLKLIKERQLGQEQE
jgi:hypothetical protein